MTGLTTRDVLRMLLGVPGGPKRPPQCCCGRFAGFAQDGMLIMPGRATATVCRACKGDRDHLYSYDEEETATADALNAYFEGPAPEAPPAGSG